MELSLIHIYPINVPYRYQFNMDPRAHGKLQIDREAADPSMILFQGKYYIFASMNLSVWVSEDMVDWQMCIRDGLYTRRCRKKQRKHQQQI